MALSDVQYTYNIWDQLVEVTRNNETTRYQYDPDGLLYERTDHDGTKTRLYYMNSKLIAECIVALDGTATLLKRYVYGLGLIHQMDSAGDKAYYLTKCHVDVVELRGQTGQLLNKYEYDIWGGTTALREDIHNPFKYAGEYWDDSTKLQYLRARWYNFSC